MPQGSGELLFDLTELKGTRKSTPQPTGIQRTVLEVAQALFQGHTPVDFICFHEATQTYHYVDPLKFFDHQEPFPYWTSDCLGLSLPEPWLEKYQSRPFRRAFHSTKHATQLLIARATGKLNGEALLEPVTGTMAPILNMGGIDTQLRLCRFAEAHDLLDLTYCYIHDLIPVRVKMGHVTAGSGKWQQDLTQVLLRKPHILTNSEFTRDDITQFLIEQGLPFPRLLQTVALAHELRFPQLETPRLRELPNHYFLLVGDIKHRKNALTVFKAYETLARRGMPIELPMLVLAGNIDPKELERMIDDHELETMARYIFVVPSPDQQTLAELYRKAEALIYPSLFEGFGMPVGEALWMGTPVLASNTTSIPEVGGKFVTYFDPYRTESLVTCLKKFIEAPSSFRKKVPKREALRNWHMVAEDLCQTLTRTWPGRAKKAASAAHRTSNAAG
ncbi:glycosyltransferase family 1 protein [Pseudovibrio exalbescens]|uniref:glycosyltransferase family 4 protein n=1 Tax=Pseudovibrio exalbescens TaxID=197461 RepID=UPI002365FC9D|nr:glycosyltransferase family 1 protein [Pseudovibrio exalbescens]MDD7910545.1 glycosyltransferase family 1 protein [Pseudovibrio exalbescens]